MKCKYSKLFRLRQLVTLSVRVWIEIPMGMYVSASQCRHPQCEGVD